MFVKECEKIVKSKKKGILNLANKQRFLLEKFEEPNKFKEMYKTWSKWNS